MWNESALDKLLADMEHSVHEGIEVSGNENEDEGDNSYQIVGYWMYRLLECKPGAKLSGPQRSISGPLFDAPEVPK